MRPTNLMRLLACLAGAATLAACTALPSAGPSAIDIAMYSATDVAPQSDSTKPKLRFEVIDVTEGVLAALNRQIDNSFSGTFGSQGSAGKIVVGRGDRVTVTIWEAASGGLFTGADGASASQLPVQPVASDGTIVVPYAGRIRAAGRTTFEIKRTIETALQGKAIDPQVLVSVVEPVFNTVTVTGEAAKGGRVPLSGRGDRLLDVIASVGGPTAPVKEVSIQLTRGNKTRRVAMERVIKRPSENVFVRAGDVVTLLRDARTLTVFGATKQNVEVPVTPSETVLSEAIARAGGLNTALADPRAVFIYRVENADLVRHLVPQSKLAVDNSLVPVIYRVNLKDPSGFFIARGFKMQDKDVLYAADAPAVQFGKFTSLLGQVLGPASQTVGIAAGVRALNE
ncbi:MAG: polysaccharide biosynthesis/export family protein [Pseudomonadota bacterium]